MDMTALLLFGRARFKVLASLFGLREMESISLRELARRTELSPTATQYELRLLLQTGLIIKDGSVGRPVYRGNAGHAIAAELVQIIRKTDATAQTAAIADDAYWRRKRVAQNADYASQDARRKSLFFSNKKLAYSFEVNLKKDVSYEY